MLLLNGNLWNLLNILTPRCGWDAAILAASSFEGANGFLREREKERHRHTLLALGIANCVVKMHLTCKTEHHDLNEKVKTYTRSMYM